MFHEPFGEAIVLATTQHTQHGADPSGLIHGYLFGADGRGQPLDAHGAAAWLAGGDAASFAWLHFDGAHHAARQWLRSHVELPEAFMETLHEAWRSTRIEQVDGGVIAVVNDVVYDLNDDYSMQVATLWMAINTQAGRRYLVSLRNQPLRAVEALRQAVDSGQTFAGPLGLLVHLLGDQADVLGRIRHRVAGEVDDIEDRFLDDQIPDRGHLGRLRRDLVRMQRLLAPEPGALFRLLGSSMDGVADDDIAGLRRSTEEFSLALRDLAGLQERIKLLQEEVGALTTDRMNKSIFVLTAVAVVALPINITAGLLGMNVGGIPFGRLAQGFWVVVAGLVLVTALAAWLLLRKRYD